MNLMISLLTVFLLSAVNGEGGGEDRIRTALMNGYNPMAFPPRPVELSIGFTILNFDMNEKENTLDADVWLKMRWNDTRLIWTDDDEYGTLHFRPSAVWTPDITLYNNAEPLLMENYGNSHVLCYPNGNMLWVPPAHARPYCTMDMTYWPYDTHKCTLKYGSWTHHAERLNVIITQQDGPVEVEALAGFSGNDTRGEWKLISKSVNRESKLYDCCTEEYITINLELELKRNSPSYGYMVQCPIAFLCLLTVVMFILPPSSGEKIILGALTLVINVILLVHVCHLFAHIPSNTPLIVQLLSKQLCITVISVILSAVILRISKSPYGKSFPSRLKDGLLAVAPCLCLFGYSEMVNSSTPQNGEDIELNQDGPKKSKSNANNSAWMLLAAVVDRVCFIVFLVIFIVLMIQFSKVL